MAGADGAGGSGRSRACGGAAAGVLAGASLRATSLPATSGASRSGSSMLRSGLMRASRDPAPRISAVMELSVGFGAASPAPSLCAARRWPRARNPSAAPRMAPEKLPRPPAFSGSFGVPPPAGCPGSGFDRASAMLARRRSAAETSLRAVRPPGCTGGVAAGRAGAWDGSSALLSGDVRWVVGVAVVVTWSPLRRVLKATPGWAGMPSSGLVCRVGRVEAAGPVGDAARRASSWPGTSLRRGANSGAGAMPGAGAVGGLDRTVCVRPPVPCGGAGRASASSEVGGKGASGGTSRWSAPAAGRAGRPWGRAVRDRKVGAASKSPDNSAWIASSSAKGSSAGSGRGGGATGSGSGAAWATGARAGVECEVGSGSAAGCQASSLGECGAKSPSVMGSCIRPGTGAAAGGGVYGSIADGLRGTGLASGSTRSEGPRILVAARVLPKNGSPENSPAGGRATKLTGLNRCSTAKVSASSMVSRASTATRARSPAARQSKTSSPTG